jgi:hypothetical protein
MAMTMIRLFEEEIASIQKAVAELNSGRRSNVAVVSEPFDGEDAEWIARAIGPQAALIEGASLAAGRSLPDMDNVKIVIIKGLHKLYSRRIGGFSHLKRIMEAIASSDQLFIATCNVYSWKYLEQTLRIGTLFPVRIDLPLLNASQLKEILLSGYKENELQYAGVKDSTGDTEQAAISFLGRRLILPDFIRSLRSASRPHPVGKSADDVFFNRLARISGGNPGVAESLWKSALAYPHVQEIPELVQDLDLDQTEAFTMNLILCAGRISKDELFSALGPEEDVLYSLSEMRLVDLVEGRQAVEILPEAIKPVAELLKRRRLIW